MGPVLNMLGRNYKDVYPRSKSMAMKSVERSRNLYFYAASILVSVTLISGAISGLAANKKK